MVRNSETYQGIIRPILVDLLRLTRKPTVGSVMASQARPTNRMMDAWKGSNWKENVCKKVGSGSAWSLFKLPCAAENFNFC